MNTKIKLLNDFLSQSPLLFDGAMGTSIQSSGVKKANPPEIINLENPEILKSIHRKYIDAGSNVIETNTFGGNRKRLENTELLDKVEFVNKRAAEIALEAAGDKVYAAGSVGPLGSLIEPFGTVSEQEAGDVFSEQINYLVDAGIELILIETMISLDEALIALKAAKNSGAKVIGVSITYNKTPAGISTSFGESPKDVSVRLEETGADFIGSNCGQGFSDMFEAAKEIRKSTSLPVLVQPNAGLPVLKDGKMVYEEGPEQFKIFVKNVLELGVNYIGGCCGTTYEHIKAAAEVFGAGSEKLDARV